MILAASILGLAILLASLIQRSYHVKPRMAHAQVAIGGITAEGEQISLTATLFEDETTGIWQERLQTLWDLRESRVKFQNDRARELFQKSMEDHKALDPELKEKLEKMGVKLQAVAPAKN